MDENEINDAGGDIEDRVRNVKIVEEMHDSYINYAMSVIVARALPDVRDGLKPVQRRILHAMNELNLDPVKAYKKCARITGDTMGKYHPHGDSSIYSALVRMAQPFSLRYPLVDGHGNFGSIDGDEPAAQRYTEARLAPMAMEMLRDIEKNTVTFVPNYDEEFTEPSVLPSRFPNLLVNGSNGIAVGMATNIPPHNLREVVDALIFMIDSRAAGKDPTPDDLIRIVRAPDFPTGAVIHGLSGARAAYRTGRGTVAIRAVSSVEPFGNGGRFQIVVTELPYQVNKAVLIKRIADLVKEKRLEGITDLRDESDRNGIRIVMELSRTANPGVILNNLYKHTQMQEKFGIIMLALVDGEPKVMGLRDMLTHYLRFQKSVVERRTRFDLARAEKRAHIVAGFLIALDHIDEIIAVIRANRDINVSKEIITERFGLSGEQADAIVEMRLRSLSGLERERLEKEAAELAALIAEMKSILADENKLLTVVRDELTVIRGKYGDERRSRIEDEEVAELENEDLIEEKVSVITLSAFGYVKRLPVSAYRSQNRGGKGVIGMGTRDEDAVKDIIVAGSHDSLMFFTDQGRVYRVRAYGVPEASRAAKGVALVNLVGLSGGETVSAVIPLKQGAEGFLTMVTRTGVVKRCPLSAFANIRDSGLRAVGLRDGDALITVKLTRGGSRIVIATAGGMGIMFDENEIRPMGREATGVKGIALRDGDACVGAETIEMGANLLTVSAGGFGKLTPADQFRLQSRGGFGTIIHRVTERTGQLIGLTAAVEGDGLMLINSEGVVIRIRVADISTTGRIAQGVKLIDLSDDVSVVGAAKIEDEEATAKPSGECQDPKS
ncbi:MAG: DNA gyrase subunit A [Clostridiales bacterium]|jgi:DNA gyrase subunit A|nr:DNA gyrase subunit A [Clostridiales bacterium]